LYRLLPSEHIGLVEAELQRRGYPQQRGGAA
jgi:hypothetical protein